jgi:hypothetical protein
VVGVGVFGTTYDVDEDLDNVKKPLFVVLNNVMNLVHVFFLSPIV